MSPTTRLMNHGMNQLKKDEKKFWKCFYDHSVQGK